VLTFERDDKISFPNNLRAHLVHRMIIFFRNRNEWLLLIHKELNGITIHIIWFGDNT
jgi:hypothetical protein